MMLKTKDLLEFLLLSNMMFLFTDMSMFLLKSHVTHVVVEVTKDSVLTKSSTPPMSISTKEAKLSKEMEQVLVFLHHKDLLLLLVKLGMMFWTNSHPNTVMLLSSETNCQVRQSN